MKILSSPQTLHLYCLILLLSGSSFAQISLDRSDFGQLGDVVSMKIDPTYFGNLTTGDTGANKTWNFPNLSPGIGIDSIKFINPSVTPYSSVFSASNLAIDDGVQLTYYNSQSNFVELQGIALYINQLVGTRPVLFDKPIKFLDFPLTYPYSLYDTSSSTVKFPIQDTFDLGGNLGNVYVDSGRLTLDIFFEEFVNGYGSLTFANLSSPLNSLRIETTQKVEVYVEGLVEIPPILPGLPPTYFWTPLPIFPPDIITKDVRYFTKNRDYSVLEFNLNSNDSILFARFQNPAILANENIAGKNSFEFSIYPNPVKDRTTILPGAGSTAALVYEIYNINGEIVKKGQLTDDYLLDLKGIKSGYYMLSLLNTKGERSSKGIIKK